MLIVSRLAQGAAAALLIPQGLGIIRAVFGPDEQGKAFAVFGPVIGLSAVLGPILGGGLIALNAFGTGWRSVFLVNLPLGLVAALGAARLMPESRSPRAPRLDVVGTVIGAAAMGLLIYPLIQGRQAGWPAWTYIMMAASAVCFGAVAHMEPAGASSGPGGTYRPRHLLSPELHRRPGLCRGFLLGHARHAPRAHPVPPVR